MPCEWRWDGRATHHRSVRQSHPYAPFLLLWVRAFDGGFRACLLYTSPLKCEYFLPFVVNEQLSDKSASLQVLPCEEIWYGVTYREDLDAVKQAVAKMKADGVYTEELWK